jgi:uncharacterized protein YbbC (DUF1343 family)
MQNWQRGDWFDSSGLAWVNPSPNMRSLTEALLYPGVAMLESATNYSVGRGTDDPFEQIGADWIDGRALAGALNSQFIPGVRVYPTRFQPTASHFSGQQIQGVRFVITNREAFDSVRLGLEIAVALQRLYPGKINLDSCLRLIGNKQVVNELKAGADWEKIHEEMKEKVQEFVNRRQPFLLY